MPKFVELPHLIILLIAKFLFFSNNNENVSTLKWKKAVKIDTSEITLPDIIIVSTSILTDIASVYRIFPPEFHLF